MTFESTSSLRVLVAEDEPAMLSLVARHMRSLGFSVIEASEGDAAWEMAQQHHPDLVVLDVMMPGMSGWEICKRLKGDASEGRPFAKTGVIMLTGIGENLNEMTSPLFAADAWLNKPFDFGELDSKVRETLGRYAKSVPSPSADKRSSSDDGKTASREAKGRADAEPAARKKTAAKNGAASRAGAAIASAVKQTKAAAKAVTKAVTDAVTEVATMVAPSAATKAAPNAATKAAPKPATKVATKPATKAAPKAATKAAPKPATKVATKPATKVATKASAGNAKKTAEKPGLKAGSAKKTVGTPAAKTSTAKTSSAKKPASQTPEKTSTQSRRAR